METIVITVTTSVYDRPLGKERDLKIPISLQTFYSIEGFLTLFALQAQPYCQICNAQKCGSQEKGPCPLLVNMANRTPQFIEH